MEEKASLGIRLKTQKNAILHFFLDFSVIIRYDSADIGTISISEERQGRGFSLKVCLLLPDTTWNVRKERFKNENLLLFLED